MASIPEPARQVDARLSVVGGAGNGVGGLVVVAFLLFVFPSTLEADQVEEITLRSAILFALFAAVALPVGRELIQRRPLRAIVAILDDRAVTEAERRRALRYPLDWALRSFGVWVFGAVVSVAVNASVDLVVAMAGATPSHSARSPPARFSTCLSKGSCGRSPLSCSPAAPRRMRSCPA